MEQCKSMIYHQTSLERKNGIKQGDSLSPLLFLQDSPRMYNTRIRTTDKQTVIRYNKKKPVTIDNLLQADDIDLMTDTRRFFQKSGQKNKQNETGNNCRNARKIDDKFVIKRHSIEQITASDYLCSEIIDDGMIDLNKDLKLRS